MAKKSVRFADDTASASASVLSSISDVDLNTLWIALGILLGLAVLTIVSMWFTKDVEGFSSGGLAVQVPDHASLETTVSGLEPGSRILYWISGEAISTEKIKELNNLSNITECSRVFLDGSQNAGVTEVGTDGIAVFRYRPFIPAVNDGGETVRLQWRVCSKNGVLGAVQESRI